MGRGRYGSWVECCWMRTTMMTASNQAGCSKDPRARREQRTTHHGVTAEVAMAKRLRGGWEQTGAGCGNGNRSRGGLFRDGWAKGTGSDRSNPKIYRLHFARRRRRREAVREGKRCVETRIARRLETIHPNPGPAKRGSRNVERNREYRREKKKQRRSKRQEEKKKKNESDKLEKRKREEAEGAKRNPKIVTWNLQRAALRENNRRRVREVAAYAVKKKWDVLMMTEITSQEEGFFWMGEEEEKVVVVHGRRAGIMLTGKWVEDWIEQGSQRWLGDRMAAIKVNHMRLVCGYQPLWHHGDVALDTYRAELESQVRLTRADEWLVIGGDHNSVVGKPGCLEHGSSEAVGRFGLGERNDAGRDFVRWCEETDLVWVNSFYPHNWRGTWCHPARNRWYEIDGFLMRRSQRGLLVQRVSTVLEDAYSDHRPKMLTIRKGRLGPPPLKRRRLQKSMKINWEVLRRDEKRMEYQQKTEECFMNVDGEEEVKWETIAKLMTKAALATCGEKRRELLTPWVAGNEAQLEELKNAIAEAVRDVRAKKEEYDRNGTDASKTELDEAKERRKIRRRDHRLALRRWEARYWEEIVEQMRQAQQRGDYGETYRILRQLGQRGTARAYPSRCFTPEEFRDHFSKVSQHEFENDQESWRKTLEGIEDQREEQKNREARLKLEQIPTQTEIWKAIKEMKDKAPGEDEVRISYIKWAAKPVQEYVTKTVQRMFETPPNRWEESIGSGLVIPLFKKGDRKDRNNYRGICLLSMGSRILARVLATRIRKWSEDLKLVDDNQHGFRTGRSTMDATQIMIRIQEETTEWLKDKQAANIDTTDNDEDGGAVLLDITKAYPRVNRPALWQILERAGMGLRCLRTVRGLHETTVYKVKGKQECSSVWTASRGLREGCATSPALFNIYHAEVMRQAKKRRRREGTARGWKVGIEWMYRSGGLLPPRSTRKAMTSSDAKETMVTDTLFADDSTLIGTRRELLTTVPTFKEEMKAFEEKCHDGKEEWVYFGKEGSGNTRMLGTWMGREKDVRERLSRGNRAWWVLKKRLRKTTIPLKTQAKIVEACVESTMLFDCAARPWMKKELKRLQQQIDRGYRYIWMNKNGGPTLKQMEQKGVNMYDIRKQLGVESVEIKVIKRCLERIGHVMRMEDDRLTKQVTLGWLKRNDDIAGRKSRKFTTITFWRRLLREAGIDEDTMETKVQDRSRWRTICREETERRGRLEARRCKQRQEEHGQEVEEPPRMQLRGTNQEHICDWEGCGKRFEKKIGLVQHRRIQHKRQELKFQCGTCGQRFKQMGNVTNHMKVCRGVTQAGQCQWCGKVYSRSNIARHERGCPKKNQQPSGRVSEDIEATISRAIEVMEARSEHIPDRETDAPRGSQTVPGELGRRTGPKYPCCCCGKGVRSGMVCGETKSWCHFTCGGVAYREVKGWSTEEVNAWQCPRH